MSEDTMVDLMQRMLGGSTVSMIGTLVVGLVMLCILMVKEVQRLISINKRKSNSGQENGVVVESRTSAQKDAVIVDSGKENCSIVYGTQTGTAEKFAKTLKSQLESAYGLTTAFHLVDAEHYDAEKKLGKETLVIFVVATYGDGEPTDDALDLHDYLKKESENVDVANLPFLGVKYAVFALGNRQYEHFCAMGKNVQKWMMELGATPLMKVGLGDDDDDIDRDFDEWSKSFFDVLASSDVLQAGEEEELKAHEVPAYAIEAVLDAPRSSCNALHDGSGSHVHSPHIATVTCARELHTKESDRSCVHVEVDISGCEATYQAGDHIGVFPENAQEVVETAAKMLGTPLSYCFTMKNDGSNEDVIDPPCDGPVTLEFALKHFADLLSAPSKASLKMLAAFAKDEDEKKRLLKLSSLDGVDSYDEYVHVPKRSLLDVMGDFPSAKPTLGAFFGSIAPRLQPRYYSISSSPKLHPRSVHITCAVVTETMPTGRIHKGVASHFLAGLTPGEKIPIFLRASSFKLPQDSKTPIIMIGPGTGLAPFRGFIQDRYADVTHGKQLGKGTLYFGCRNRRHDFIYEEELKRAYDNNTISELHVAFSREGSHKDYVQHHMAKHGKEIWSILSGDGCDPGYLYVCGDGKYMARDVNRVLHDIVVQQTGCSGNEAEAIVKDMADQGRYLKDVW